MLFYRFKQKERRGSPETTALASSERPRGFERSFRTAEIEKGPANRRAFLFADGPDQAEMRLKSSFIESLASP